MKQILCVVTLGGCLLAVNSNPARAEDEWRYLSAGIGDVQSISVGAQSHNQVFFGAKSGFYKTTDRGAGWRFSRVGNTAANDIRQLCIRKAGETTIYAATAGGLYKSNNNGDSWVRVFTGRNEAERDSAALAVSEARIYLGTAAGLFIGDLKTRRWTKAAGLNVTGIAEIGLDQSDSKYIYIACRQGAFYSRDAAHSWQPVIFALGPRGASDTGDGAAEAAVKDSRVYSVSVMPTTGSVYYATSRGLYGSHNHAGSWERLTSYGLLGKEAYKVLGTLDNRLLAITDKGIFEFKSGRWQELSLRLSAQGINTLSVGPLGALYAGCRDGLYMMTPSKEGPKSDAPDPQNFQGPAIRQVQEAAIRYTDLGTQKIRQWRSRAANKAWLPQLNLGLNRDVTDLWHWESGSTTKNGDDVLARGKDSLEWDVSLSWDLGEIIWNDDELAIDVRARLLTQQRQDLLDEVTKLYYERIRVQEDLAGLRIEEVKKRRDKQLRLAELTAMLDGMTGNYFSNQP